MQPFSSPIAASKERVAVWLASFPKLLLVTFLLAGSLSVLLATLTPSTAKAQTAPVSTHAIQISEIIMFDQQHGWAFNWDHTHVFSTRRGPEHWIDATPSFLINTTNNIMTASFFFNATHGYLGILQNDKTFLLSTQNSGKTWQITPFLIPIISNPVSIFQITFLDTQHGWLAFNRNNSQPGHFDILLMSTSNGGKTWQTLLDTTQNPTSLPVPFSLSGRFTFVSPLNGWVTGIWLSGDVYLYSTHDGGKTWSSANIATIKGENDSFFSQGYGPFWQNNHTGTLFVKYDSTSGNGMPHLTAYQTQDTGKTWTLLPSSPSTSYGELSNLSFLNAHDGWSFGFDAQGQYTIHHTSTGSFSWQIFHPTGLPQADPATQVVSDLTFLNARTGWVIIGDGQGNSTLFQTNKSGQTWQTLHPVTN